MTAGDGLNRTESSTPCLEGASMDGTPVKYTDERTESEDSVDSADISVDSGIEYNLKDSPPWSVTVVYAMQQCMTSLSRVLGMAFIIYSNTCTQNNPVLLAELLSIGIFMAGLSSFLQTTFGVRLPVVQSSAGAFIPPLLALLSPAGWTCPQPNSNNITENATLNSTAPANGDELWKYQLNEISGGLMMASLLEVVVGATGVLGVLMAYIGPLTLTPCITLIGITMVTPMVRASQSQWGISLLTIGVIVLCAVPLSRVRLPLPTYRRGTGCRTVRINFFRLFPHLMAISVAWLLCGVLTLTGVFLDDPSDPSYRARTDAKLDVLYQTPWVFLPYPGRWGWPVFTLRSCSAMLAATLSSIIDSMGDFYATARVCGVRRPPPHAVSRGVLVEGVCGFLSGLLGACHGTSSLSSTVGFISIAKLSSRVVWQMMGVMMMLFGVFGKLGAVLALVPDPIIGGTMAFGAAMVVSVGLGNLHSVDLRSSRNQLVLGLAFCFGLGIPAYLKGNPGVISTGSKVCDQTLQVFLGTRMFVGGLVGFILDNSLPGTKEERGIQLVPADGSRGDTDPQRLYDLPQVLSRLQALRCSAYLPFMPYHDRPGAPRVRSPCFTTNYNKVATSKKNVQNPNYLEHNV